MADRTPMMHGFSLTAVAVLLGACGGAGQEAPHVDSLPSAAAPASSAGPLDELAPADAASFTSLHLGSDEILVLDPRATRRAPRASSLLVVEIRQLEALLGITGPAAPDRPMLLRRLAEDDVELAEAATNEAQNALDRYDDATAKARWFLAWEDARMTPPSTSGCTKDVDCKGNRICEHGACVAPQ